LQEQETGVRRQEVECRTWSDPPLPTNIGLRTSGFCLPRFFPSFVFIHIPGVTFIFVRTGDRSQEAGERIVALNLTCRLLRRHELRTSDPGLLPDTFFPLLCFHTYPRSHLHFCMNREQESGDRSQNVFLTMLPFAGNSPWHVPTGPFTFRSLVVQLALHCFHILLGISRQTATSLECLES